LGLEAEPGYTERVCGLLRERIRLPADLPGQAVYFFREDYPLDPKALRKRLQKPGVPERLDALRICFEAVEAWTAEALEGALRARAEAGDEQASDYIHPVRVAVTGVAGGPGLFDLLEILGRDRVLARLARGQVLAAGDGT